MCLRAYRTSDHRACSNDHNIDHCQTYMAEGHFKVIGDRDDTNLQSGYDFLLFVRNNSTFMTHVTAYGLQTE